MVIGTVSFVTCVCEHHTPLGSSAAMRNELAFVCIKPLQHGARDIGIDDIIRYNQQPKRSEWFGVLHLCLQLLKDKLVPEQVPLSRAHAFAGEYSKFFDWRSRSGLATDQQMRRINDEKDLESYRSDRLICAARRRTACAIREKTGKNRRSVSSGCVYVFVYEKVSSCLRSKVCNWAANAVNVVRHSRIFARTPSQPQIGPLEKLVVV